MKYKVVYIDEEDRDAEDFLNYFEKYKDFSISHINPQEKEYDQIVDEIIDGKANGVVLDFYLKYQGSKVPFNGDELLKRIQDRKPFLPVMIFTSRLEEALEGDFSPDRKKNILRKDLINNPDDQKFKDVVKEKIDYYLETVQGYKLEFGTLKLKEKKGEKLSNEEVRRVKVLDRILEEIGDREKVLDNQTEKNIEDIKNLVEKTEEIIKRLTKK
jgi:hypothetical protein